MLSMRPSLVALCLLAVLPAQSVPSVRSPVHNCCLGKRIQFSWCWGDTIPYFWTDSKGVVRGFVPDVLYLLSAEMKVEIDFRLTELYANATTGERTTELTTENWGADFILFELGKNNAFLGLQTFYGRFYNTDDEDVLFNTNMASFVKSWPQLISMPFFSSRYLGLIRTSRAMSEHWRLFDPFEYDVWLSIVAVLCVFAIAIVILETLARTNSNVETGKGAMVRSALRAWYHTWAALLNGEDYEWNTWPGRILRVGILFFVILTTSTYTANLAAFFTAPGVVIHGPEDMDSLRISRAYVIDAEEGVQVQPFVKSVVSGYGTAPGINGRLGPLMQDVRLAIELGLDLLAKGEVDVFLGDGPLMSYLQQQNCANTTIAKDVSFGKWGFVLAMRQEDIELASHFQAALQWVANVEEYQAIERKHFGSGQQCERFANVYEVCRQIGGGSDLKKVTLQSQAGVYVITGTLVVAALVSGVVQRAAERGEEGEGGEDCSKTAGGEEGCKEGEMMLRVLERLDRVENLLRRPARSAEGREQQERAEHGLAPSAVEASMFEVASDLAHLEAKATASLAHVE